MYPLKRQNSRAHKVGEGWPELQEIKPSIIRGFKRSSLQTVHSVHVDGPTSRDSRVVHLCSFNVNTSLKEVCKWVAKANS